MKNLIVSIVAIICIAGMEMWAMAHGHDGMLLVGCVAVIAGLAGYNVPGLIDQLKNQSKTNNTDQDKKE